MLIILEQGRRRRLLPLGSRECGGRMVLHTPRMQQRPHTVDIRRVLAADHAINLVQAALRR